MPIKEHRMLKKIQEIEDKRKRLLQMGGPKAVESQHKAGKLTARERVERLVDPGTFQELNLWIRSLKTGFDVDKRELPGDAIVTGFAKINGRPVYVISEDLTVLGGTFGMGFHHKITRIMQMAVEHGVPYVQLIDSGGERIHDIFGRPGFRPILGGRVPVGGTATLYQAPGLASGVVPQITLMVGPSYAGSAYSPTMADFYIMRKGTAFMSVASPQLLKAVTFKDVTQEQIGGSVLHSTVTGIADFLLDTDEEVIAMGRELVTYIPLNHREKPPLVEMNDDPDRREERLLGIVPEDLSRPYDMHEVIRAIVDQGKFFELQQIYAKSLIIGFARLDGQTVGIVANNPGEENGALTLNTCDKQARFIRWCDAFNVPLIYLVDTPGFAAGGDEEQSREGLLRTVPKAVFAICEATVPQLTVNIGRNFGPGRMVMGNLRTGVDFAYSWPCAQVARINPADAVERIYAREIASAPEPEKARAEKLAEMLKSTIRYPYHAAEQVMVNDLIDPRDTRPLLIKTLKHLANKKLPPRPWRKHGLIQQ
jgi:methylmalonyl-CoA decarboxylase subunit alpha